MKTSIKNNSRFIGIAVLMMVLSIVTGNLNAQKSYNDNKLAVLSHDFITNSKYEILHAISDLKSNNTVVTEEPVENWMASPLEWSSEENAVLPEEVNFEENEMLLEDWMNQPKTW